MEAETTESPAETTENSFASALSVCGACKNGFEEKDPKLLPCLHTFCSDCVTMSDTGENNMLKCSTCHSEWPKDVVIDNIFIQKNRGGSSSDVNPANEFKSCDGCEENVEATSYCNECSEWLCDQCVQAHRRVKITKDHVIQPKDRVVQGTASAAPITPKIMHCPQHRNELLKLYCETCEKLTCRDCQLLEHKDHKYYFVQEAAEMYKLNLQSLLGKIKEKSTYVENAKALIDKRNREISEKEKKVTNDIKMFAVKLITEVNKRGKQLLTDLQSICGAKKTQLGQKSREIDTLSKGISHAVNFAEYALNSSDQTAMLFTKGVLVNQLKKILRTRCEVPNPYHVVDIRLQADHNFVLNSIPKLGTIVMDGVPFTSARNQANMPVPVQIASSTASLPTTIKDIQSHSSAGSHGPSGHTSHSSNHGNYRPRQKPPGPLSLQNLNENQRQMVINRMRQMHELKRRGGSQMGTMSPPVTSGRPMFPGSSAAARMANLPNQSSNISSSNHHHQSLRSSNIYFPGSQPHPRASMRMGGQSLSGPMINLAQLQEERYRRLNHRGTVSTTSTMGSSSSGPSPIVIQPQQYNSPATTPPLGQRRSPSGLPDCMQDNIRNGNQYNTGYSTSPPIAESSIRQEETERPSCSFSTIPGVPVKIEPKPETEFGGLNLAPSSISFDADPKTFLDIAKNKNASNRHEQPLSLTVEDRVGSLTVEDRSSSPGSRTSTPRIESTNQELGAADDNERLQIGEDGVLNLSSRSVGLESGRAASSPSPLRSETSDQQTEQGLGQNLEQSLEQNVEQGLDRSLEQNLKQGLEQGLGKSGSTHQGGVDESEDYCGVCHNGGNLLCCDGCPKVFHLTCHVPTITQEPSGSEQWYCGLCDKPEDIRLTSPDVRSESVGSKRKSPAGLTQREQKVCERILLEIMCHESSTAFQEPVPKTVPNYHKIIHSPMDFGTIKHRLSRSSFNRYMTVESFVADCNLVFYNCATYNHPESEVAKCGIAVRKAFDKLLRKLLPYIDPRSATPQSDSGEGRHKAKRKRVRDEPKAGRPASREGRYTPGEEEYGQGKREERDGRGKGEEGNGRGKGPRQGEYTPGEEGYSRGKGPGEEGEYTPREEGEAPREESGSGTEEGTEGMDESLDESLVIGQVTGEGALNLSQESGISEPGERDEDYAPETEESMEEEDIPPRRKSTDSRHSRKSTDSHKSQDENSQTSND